MASVFYVRHQAAGIMYEYPFASHPSDAQQAAVVKVCFQRCGGRSHPKTPNEPYWVRVEEHALLGSEVPDVPDVVLTPVSVKGHGKSDAGEVSVSGRGRVENPKASE